MLLPNEMPGQQEPAGCPGYSRNDECEAVGTRCIAERLHAIPGRLGVAVVIEAQHMCMVMCGIQKQHLIATIPVSIGEFNVDKTRAEFMRLVGRTAPAA